jgi:hypothetical protein
MLLIRHVIDAEPVVIHACTNCKNVITCSTPPILVANRPAAHTLSLFFFPITHYRRSPTLLYTQRLENKVAQLEAALLEAKRSPDVSQAFQSQSESSETGESSNTDKDARVSLSENISLFQLPGSIRSLALANEQAEQEIAAGKESLVNSAWRERAYERLADIPVRQKMMSEGRSNS